MTVLSLIRLPNPSLTLAKLLRQDSAQAKFLLRNITTSGSKCGGHGHGPSSLQIIPTKYQWHKYKDQLHFYVLLGVIPLSAVVFFANVFIGPSTLTEIPEGYEPKPWEYYRSPITRFIVKNCMTTIQETYERNLHYINGMDEKRRMRLLAWKVEKLMRDRGDYPNYFTNQTIYSKYIRGMQLERDYIESTTGEF